MKLETINKLSAACHAAALPEAQRLVSMSRNVSERPELSYPHVKENEKTNPPPGVGRTKGAKLRELSPRQAAAVELLVGGRTACAVARQLGVDRRSVFRWKNDERFKAAVAERVRALNGVPRPARIAPPPAPVVRSSGPTMEERAEMEELLALAGITPSWKKPPRGARS